MQGLKHLFRPTKGAINNFVSWKPLPQRETVYNQLKYKYTQLSPNNPEDTIIPAGRGPDGDGRNR